MFLYFPLRGTDGATLGSVRYADGKATVSLSRAASCTLFSGETLIPVTPGEPVRCPAPDALLGTQNGAVTVFGAAPGNRKTAAAYFAMLSRFHTMQASNPVDTAPEPAKDLPKTPADPAETAASGSDMSQIRTGKPESKTDAAVPEWVQDATPWVWTNEVPSAPGSKPALEPSERPFLPLETRHVLACETEPPMVRRAREMLAALAVRSDLPVPKTVHNVDNSVDNSADSAFDLVQKGDRLRNSDATDALLGWQDGGGAVGVTLFGRIFPGAKWRFVAADGVLPHFEGTWEHGSERIRILAVRGEAAPTPPPGLSGFTRYLKNDGVGYWVRLIPMGKQE